MLFGTGAVFAALMFAPTAWSLPLVLDRRTDFGRAVLSNVRATVEQPLPLLTWGAIVAGLTALRMITFFAAFVVIFPWLDYSTWAAHKDPFAED